MDNLLRRIRSCTECASALPLGPRPIVVARPESVILIVGQAPGRAVHESGIPWDDPSGIRLRNWMTISDADFYNPKNVAILPMGFCYPGTGKSGDYPPRPECAPLWHEAVRDKLTNVRLTLLLSNYALAAYLPNRKRTLTETVRAWREYAPEFLPLPHPSPRNNRWLKKNPWFAAEVLPYLSDRVRAALDSARR
jgi:uracil-DNA glycosylase